jgi:NADPH-dependent 2,4-dienoyl-CoA reductase/sulfur reductase-like enzyme
MNDINRVVIVGGGLAGASAAFELRKLGFASELTLIGEEGHLPYKRPPMSKEYLRGEEPIDKAYVKPADEYTSKGVNLISRTRATAVDPTRRVVELADGKSVAYDALVLATGAAPRRLNVPGADSAPAFYLRDVDDADDIRAAALRASSVVVIGGGWIGTEVASSLCQLGCHVTMIAPPPLPLEPVLGREVAAVYRQLHDENGIRLVVGSVAAFAPGHVMLGDGQSVAGDMFVVGIGAVPRTELAQAAGLTLRDRGVEVDAYLRSSEPHIYVAGDIATAWHPRYERYLRLEHWDNAKEQGKHVAANIMGANTEYARTPYFYSDQFDLGMEYRGLAREWDGVVIRGDLAAREFDAFWLRDSRVVAAMNANRWDDAAELQDLVERGAVVAPEALAAAPVLSM